MAKADAWDLVTADDPTDWKDDFIFLKGLDSSLRCDLCYDIYTAPVSIKDCSHTFCSACIRNAINKPGEEMGSRCPRCMNKNVYDSSLLPQPALENAAQQWRKARKELVKMQEAEKVRQQQQSSMASTSASSLSGQNHSSLGKREFSELDPSSPQRRRSKRNVLSKKDATPNYVEVVDDSSEEEIFDDQINSPVPNKEKSSGLVQNGNAKIEKDYREINASDLVQCPLCQYTFTFRALNIHLDKGTCSPSDPEPSAQERGLNTVKSNSGTQSTPTNNWLKSSSGSTNDTDSINANGRLNDPNTGKSKEDRRRKLVRPAYDMLKIADIKKLLKDWNLNFSGNDRKRMVERHRKWINLFNANLDASEPMRKSDTALRSELEQWERAQERAANSGISEKRAKTWAMDHRDDFASLARQARESHARDRSKHKEEQDAEKAEKEKRVDQEEQTAEMVEGEEEESENMDKQIVIPNQHIATPPKV